MICYVIYNSYVYIWWQPFKLKKNIFMLLSYKYAYVQNGVKSCYINKVTGEWLENHVQPF